MRTGADLVTVDDVRAAAARLAGVAVTTPIEHSRALSEHLGGPVYAKCENLQRTGSFKIRGAYNRISRLGPAEREAGVVAASAGNHAQGVALAATLSGVRSTVFMPAAASLPKVEATKRYGAEVVLTGKDFGEAFAAAQAHAERTGAVFVHPFDHPDVIAGQGTIALELLDQLPHVATVVVPVGGGGLISGIAAVLKELRQGCRIVGVQAEGAAAFPPSLQRGEPMTLEAMATIADGIAANRPGELTLAHVQAFVDDVVVVSDEAIAEALVLVLERMKLVLEPSGAAGVAALLGDVCRLEPPVAVVFSGGNVDPLLLQRIVRFGLSSSGRYFAFRTRLLDVPGALHSLLGLIAEQEANIVGVEHHREGVSVNLGEVEVALQLETRGRDHIDRLTAELTAAGYTIERL